MAQFEFFIEGGRHFSSGGDVQGFMFPALYSRCTATNCVRFTTLHMVHIDFSQVAWILKGNISSRGLEYQEMFGSHEPDSTRYYHSNNSQGEEDAKRGANFRVVLYIRRGGNVLPVSPIVSNQFPISRQELDGLRHRRCSQMISRLEHALVRGACLEPRDTQTGLLDVCLGRFFGSDLSPEYSVNLHSLRILSRRIPGYQDRMRINVFRSDVQWGSREIFFSFMEASHDGLSVGEDTFL
uniref:Uncharacterized protein n=1 Tax=Cacopsylla melanoneura TaxID=428564 RepID=A0A8D9BCL9_9HEMI